MEDRNYIHHVRRGWPRAKCPCRGNGTRGSHSPGGDWDAGYVGERRDAWIPPDLSEAPCR